MNLIRSTDSFLESCRFIQITYLYRIDTGMPKSRRCRVFVVITDAIFFFFIIISWCFTGA